MSDIGRLLSAVRPRELADLYRAARDEGCDVTMSAGTHIVVLLPSGAKYHGPFTSSDRRAVLNVRTQLRRLGLSLPRNDHRKAKR